MHGRLKVKSTAEQLEAKRKEREIKLHAFKGATQKIFSKRRNGEYDDEALFLTKEVLQGNPDFYTLWNYRKEIFLHMKPEKLDAELQKLCCEELLLTQSCLMKNPKSYCAWQHRVWVMEFMPEPDWVKELQLLNSFLSMDERNFHCWDYRRYVCGKCDLKASEELAFTTDLIKKNFSNYSAWHYRSTLLPYVHPGSGHVSVDETVLLNEYELVQNATFTDPSDQSAWFYHRWLLGRGERPLEILMLYVSRCSLYTMVLLSAPVKLSNICSLKLLVDGILSKTSWKPVGDNPYASAVWQCRVDPFTFEAQSVVVAVEFSNASRQSTMSCVVDKYEVIEWRNTYKSSLFVSDLSAATKDVLEKELESCEQLCELEPNNKWSLLTCILLMRVLDSKKYKDTIFSYFEKLVEVDHYRAQYYRDLRSKLRIENVIESLSPGVREVSLANSSLTTLHHLEHLVLIGKLDLSGNNLCHASNLNVLVFLHVLILDENKLTNCKGMEQLRGLRYLSLKQNYITSLDDLSALAECRALRHLCIKGNPVTTVPQYRKKLRAFIKRLNFLDDEPL